MRVIIINALRLHNLWLLAYFHNRTMEFPPRIEQEYEKELIENLRAYCLGNGLVLLPPPSKDDKAVKTNTGVQAPVSLFPTPFPKKLYGEANNVGIIFNELYANISRDIEFIDEVMSEISRYDSFQASLWGLWRNLRRDICQPNQLLVSRSDYLCNTSTDAQGNVRGLSQVEFNTIASSFGGLSKKVNELHQYLYNDIRYKNLHPLLNNQLAENETLSEIVDGFEHAHQVYKSGYLRSKHSPYILFVVQENERNVFDQRLLEFELSRWVKCT